MSRTPLDGYESGTLPAPYLPVEVSDVLIAFPGAVMHLMPKWEDIPEDLDERWISLADALFAGTADELELLPSVFLVENACEPEQAWRHLRCVFGTFGAKHEHKIAAAAFLLSTWFRYAKWLDNRNPKLAKVSRERTAGSPELPPEYGEREEV